MGLILRIAAIVLFGIAAAGFFGALNMDLSTALGLVAVGLACCWAAEAFLAYAPPAYRAPPPPRQ